MKSLSVGGMRWRFGRRPIVSCIICSIDDKKLSAVEGNYRSLLEDTAYEIITIRDARSLAEAYNRGIARAKGDYLIFSHDDIRILSPDFSQRLRKHLTDFDVIGVAGTTLLQGGAWFLAGYPYNHQLVITPNRGTEEQVIYVQGDAPIVVPGAQALDGLFLAMRASVAQTLLFDEAVFDGFHLYDIDFTFRAYLAEYRLAVCRDIVIIHESHGRFDEVWDKYRTRFDAKFAAFLPARKSSAKPRVGRFQLEERILTNPDGIRALCEETEIESLIRRTMMETAGSGG